MPSGGRDCGPLQQLPPSKQFRAFNIFLGLLFLMEWDKEHTCFPEETDIPRLASLCLLLSLFALQYELEVKNKTMKAFCDS